MKVLAFGEILFDVDVANDKRNIGGAPLNFCAHLSFLGEDGYILSSVGNDELGKMAMDAVSKFNLNSKYVSMSDKFQTGQALVTYHNGEPTYDLSMISAYDNIDVSENIEQIKNENFDVLYFGTLAQRNDCSRRFLKKLLNEVKFETVFYDVNLRQNYYTEEIIRSGLKYADIVKVNRDEMVYLSCMEGINSVDYKVLCERYDIKYLIVTKDEDGAGVYELKTDTFYTATSQKAELVSAVGAGDSFSACFVHNYFNGVDIKTCLERANKLGAYVIGFKEAVPEYTDQLKRQIKAN